LLSVGLIEIYYFRALKSVPRLTKIFFFIFLFCYTASTTTPTVTASPSSAFERFKALRRSRQRTGHKSHKKRYKDYLKRQHPKMEVTSPPEIAPAATISTRHLQKLQKERERSTHSAPIFAIGLRPQRPLVATGKPFYEGQVNYYDNQQQLDVDLKHHTEMERLIAHDYQLPLSWAIKRSISV